MENTLIVIGEVILVPVLTFLTMWVKSNNEKDVRRDKRDDSYIKNLENRIIALEVRLDAKENEIREIRHELKNRDAEYIKLYQEYTTLKAKYEVLQTDHDELRKNYNATVDELTSIKVAIKEDRKSTADLAIKTAQTI